MGVGDDRLREQRDTAWDALDEIHAALRGDGTDASKLDLIGAIISNGPLDTAPGGRREDECERLRSRVRELEDALRLIAGTDWVDAVLDPERPLRVARVVLASSSAPSYAKHVGAGSAPGEDPHNGVSSAPTDTTCPRCEGRRYVCVPGRAFPCPRCSGSGRVPTKEETCPDCRATGYCDRDACHVATKDQP